MKGLRTLLICLCVFTAASARLLAGWSVTYLHPEGIHTRRPMVSLAGGRLATWLVMPLCGTARRLAG